MNPDKFKEIVLEASDLYVKYKSLTDKANYIPDQPPRKEDHREYWIAHVAFEKGKNSGSLL